MSLEQAILTLAEAIRYHGDCMKDQHVHATGNVMQEHKRAEEKPAAVDETPEATPEPEKKPAAKKKTAAKKKPKPEPEETEEVEEADDVADEPEEVEEADDAEASYDTDDIRRAAMSVRDEVGREALATALKAFKAKKISELKEENFGAFIRHCENLIESGSAE